MRRTIGKDLITKYFLGELSQEERAGVEDRYLADSEVFEQFIAVENDLIDAYCRGELTEDKREKFEAEYSKSPRRRKRVDFAHALGQVSESETYAAPDIRVSIWNRAWAVFAIQGKKPRWALAAIVLVMLASGSWLLMQNERLRVDLQHALAEEAELRHQQEVLSQHIAMLEGQPEGEVHEHPEGSEIAKLESPPEVTLSLTPGVARGIGGQHSTLRLPADASYIRLQLMLDRDEYKTYEAALLNSEQTALLRAKALRSHSIGGSVAVTWRLPVQSLRSGDYIIQLAGQSAKGNLESAGSYSLRLLRRNPR